MFDEIAFGVGEGDAVVGSLDRGDLPGEIDLGGQLLKGEDSFTVGGTLDVGVRQEAGKYTGSFAVAVEYQ